MKPNNIAKRVCIGIAAALVAGVPLAQAQLVIRIGDEDGFGYGAAAGYHRAMPAPPAPGAPANVGPLGNLTVGDFLPDLPPRDGTTRAGNPPNPGPDKDDFDNRTAAEVGNSSIQLGSPWGKPVNDNGSIGSKWTDISISNSYGTSQAASDVHSAGVGYPGIRGPGGLFPDATPGTLPNIAELRFKFLLPKASWGASKPGGMYFDMVFGDYDIPETAPAGFVDLYYHGSATPNLSLPLTVNPLSSDGLIDRVETTLDSSLLFVDAGLDWSADLRVVFNSPGEFYYAIDYAGITVPESSTMAAIGFTALGMVAFAVRRRMAVG